MDAESILEACETTFGERRRLKWHYRSRCESLIAFSNDAFYEGGLITFPMARPGSFSIDLVRVDGINRAGRNPAEAAHVAEEAVAFMRHHADLPERDVPSLGIVAVNVEQRELLLEELASDARATTSSSATRRRSPPRANRSSSRTSRPCRGTSETTSSSR